VRQASPVDLILRLTFAHLVLTHVREQVLVKRRRMGECKVGSGQISVSFCQGRMKSAPGSPPD
jgi:hypothetical protein